MKMEKSTKEGEGGVWHLNDRNPLGRSDHRLKASDVPLIHGNLNWKEI